MTGIARALDFPEHGTEIDRALARLLMDFIRAVIVGKPHLVAKAEIHGVDEFVDPDAGKEMGVVRREGPAQRRIVDLAEEMHAFGRRDRHVVHLRQDRFPVEVLQQQQHIAPGGIVRHPLQPVDGGLHPDRPAGREVIAAMNDDPFRAQLRREIDIGLHVAVDSIAAEG